MTRFVPIPATLDHAESLIKDVRQADRNEWVAGSGEPTLDRLRAAIAYPVGIVRTVVLAATHEVLLIWGAHDDPEDGPCVGRAWLIATNLAMRHAIGLHSLMDVEVALMDATYERTVALADARNRVHHKWLIWLGYDYFDTTLRGPWSLPFYRFERHAHVRPRINRNSHGGRLHGPVGGGVRCR